MGLKSFFSRRRAASDAPPPAAPRARARATQRDAGDAVQQARVRARQRLTGAVILLGIGVIGFPLLFETQPRPIPVDIPITIPNKDSVAPLAAPEPARAATVADAASAASPMIDETAADAGRDPASAAVGASAGMTARVPLVDTPGQPVAPASAGAVKAAQAADTATGKSAEKAAEKAAKAERAAKAEKAAAVNPHDTAAKPVLADADAARAKALLDGESGSAASAAVGGRFVVQVGAFADASSAHQARQKVEKLGLKTYTQVVETAGGKRIRVRVGPFASRDDASQAAGKLHAAGLPSAVLTL